MEKRFVVINVGPTCGKTYLTSRNERFIDSNQPGFLSKLLGIKNVVYAPQEDFIEVEFSLLQELVGDKILLNNHPALAKYSTFPTCIRPGIDAASLISERDGGLENKRSLLEEAAAINSLNMRLIALNKNKSSIVLDKTVYLTDVVHDIIRLAPVLE